MESVYERGGADFCHAIVHDDVEALAVLNTLFSMHELRVVATDGSFSDKKSVNLTIFLQTKESKLPEKSVVESILARHLNLSSYDYVLVEAQVMAENNDLLLCLALTFQGDDAIGMARETLPALAALEQRMKQIVTKASGLLTKVRVVATSSLGLFAKKSSRVSSQDSQQSPSKEQDNQNSRGPGR